MDSKVSDHTNILTLKNYMQNLYRATGMACRILDMDNSQVLESGWQELCGKFHRTNHKSLVSCKESDEIILMGLKNLKDPKEQKYTTSRCNCGLVSAGIPIKVDGKTTSALHVCQFFFEPPDVEFFWKQALRLNYDAGAYLDALYKVPVIPREKADSFLNLYVDFAEMVARFLGKSKDVLNKEPVVEKNTAEDYKSFLQNFKGIVFQGDLNYNIIFFHGQVEEITGYRAEDFTQGGLAWNKIVYPEDLPIFVKVDEKILTTPNHSEEFEYRIVRKDGKIRWLSETLQNICDESGKPIKVQGVIHDITARKKMEEKLIYQKKHYEALFNNTTEAIVYFDTSKNIYDVNKQFTSLFGYELDEIKGKSLNLVVDPTQRENNYHDEEVLEQGKTINFEAVRYRKNNKQIDVLVKCAPVIIDGKIVGGYAMYSDITNRKQNEEALQESEEKFRSIVENVNDVIATINKKGEFQYVSPNVKEICGYDVDDVQGRPIMLFIHQDDIYGTMDKLNEVFVTGQKQASIEYRFRHRDGRWRWFKTNAAPLRDDLGNIKYTVGVFRDITSQKEVEEKLKYLSFHDQLTGIYNRAYFENEMKRLEGSREYPITIICADVDGLKLVNDTMGHQYGDELLKACARVLKEPLRKADILAHIGGDEFAVILPRTDNETGKKVLKRIREAVNIYNSKNPKVFLSFSLGMATTSSAEQSLADVFSDADDDMYKDKLIRGSQTRGQIVNALLTALAEKDYMDMGHAQRLQNLCWKLGKRVGLSARQLADIDMLAQVHDLGKVVIPRDILTKSLQLTAEEWTLIRQHPEKGYRIAKSSPNLASIADLILKHHEKWDGTGYPLGIRGEEIPLECRVFAIVDAYDAMTNERPYRKVRSKEEAIEELKQCSGSQFDPGLIDIFILVIRENHSASNNG
ncbi:MAG: PAS domain S-box protein [Bacillota bacterium]